MFIYRDVKIYDYNQFINESNQDIESICREYGIENYTINRKRLLTGIIMSIDVDGDVNISSEILTKLPLKFRNVSGGFYCYNNQLTTLEGGPSSVGGNFYCYENQLTTLEGGPSSVGGNFNCYENQLTTLEGGPSSVGGDFDCSINKLTNFYGFPEDWEGDINFTNNPCREILNLFAKEKWCQSIALLNEFEVIRGNKIFIDGLEEVCRQLKVTMPENLELENYEII